MPCQPDELVTVAEWERWSELAPLRWSELAPPPDRRHGRHRAAPPVRLPALVPPRSAHLIAPSRRVLQRDIPAVGTKPSLRAAAVVLHEVGDAEPTQRR